MPHWPVYFTKRPLKGKMISYGKGELFRLQDTHYIRGLGAGFGVPDARQRDFADLDYVQVLDCGTQPVAASIITQHLNYTRAKQLLEGRDG